MKQIDLRSDTVTRPSDAMRAAMMTAEVGDDVYAEDPTVARLQAIAAERLGKEAALFVPSGTMANQLALRVHTQPGDEVIAGQNAHIYLYESGAGAALSGVQFHLVGSEGLFSAADVVAAVNPVDQHYARTRMVVVENTHNRGGGRIFPLSEIKAIAAVAADTKLGVHLDGARVFNAEIASGTAAAEWAKPFDSVSFCLSKGLGAPIGSLLCGSKDFISAAHRYRKMFGGGMRQVGIIAAAGIYALEHHVSRLADDHTNAKRLADGLRALAKVDWVTDPETNIVLFRVGDLESFLRRTLDARILINPIDAETLRAVTHLDVSADDIEHTLRVLTEVLG